MTFIAVVLVLFISAAIDLPLILKAAQIEEETDDPTNSKKVLLFAIAGFLVPSVVSVVVFKLLL